MRLLIVGLNYAPEPVGIGPYTAGLATSLAARGHAVEVVAGKPYYPQWRAYPGQGSGRTRSIEDGVAITRVPHYIPAIPSGARRIVHHLSFAASAAGPALAAARRGIDAVFTVAPSLLSAPVAARAARRAGVPLWLHVQDFEIEAARATGLIANSPAAEIAGRLERRILNRADMVSTISPQMCAKLAKKGVREDNIYQLRNWSDASFDFAAARPDTYRQEWRLGDRKVALYSGNIANKQGIEIIIEAARHLAARQDIVFVICGEGPNRARLAELARGMDNVQLHDLQPVARMPDLLSLATVHLLPQIPGAADLVLPSKLTNMLASGRPVVATAVAGTGLADEVAGCGTITPPGDAKALARAVAALVDDEPARLRLGDAARSRASERWSREAIIDAFEARLLALCDDRRKAA